MKKILLVEDNAASRKLFGDLLVRAGHDVTLSDNADEGIERALDTRFDLILMDIQLPGTDGFTAAKLLRANAITRDLPMIAVTAHAMRGDERRILDAGFDAYVAKPVSYRLLLSEVERLLGEGARQRQRAVGSP